jgi:hypothetical protein
LLDAAKITHLTGDLRILQVFAGNCGQMLVPLPATNASSDDCMVLLANMAAEFGELVTEVSLDLADGSISDNDLERIDRESGDLISAVHAMRVALAARNLAGRRV